MQASNEVLELVKSPWGPGLLFGVLIYRLGNRLITLLTEGAQRFLASHEKQADAITTLAGAQAVAVTEQRETTVAVQALSLKIDEVKAAICGFRCPLKQEKTDGR